MGIRIRRPIRTTLGVAAAGVIAAGAFVAVQPAAAYAASTCQTHNVDGFSIGMCVNQIGTNDWAEPDMYVNSVNANALNGCYIELELWSENGNGRVAHTNVPCTQGYHAGDQWTPCYYDQVVHADGYLHAANGGFRIGPSASVTIKENPVC